MPPIITLYFDGCSKGNPGPSGAGFYICSDDNSITLQGHKYLGNTTNNVAEYNGLILGLEILSKNIPPALREVVIIVKGDSKLVIEQMLGNWKVSKEHLKPLWTKATNLSKEFPHIEFTHVRRDLNKHADEMANKALTTRD